jgi:predicted aspartyl protease
MIECRACLLGLTLLLCAPGMDQIHAQAPRIGKPVPVPLGPSTISPLPPAVIDPTLAIGGMDLKARETETRLSVDVRIDGRGPYHFVVDSGADTSVIGLQIVKSLQLPLGSPVILNGMTGSEEVDRVKVDALTLGPSTVRNVELPVLRETDVGGDGLIGIDALAEQRLMLDFEKRLIKVEGARKPWKNEPGDIVIVARRRRGQLILTQVRAAGLPVLAVIDTGAEVTIGNTALRDRLLRKHRQKLWTADMIGVTGVHVQMLMAVIDELRVGPVTLEDVPIAFADVPPFGLFGLSDEPALLLGTDVLQTFRRVSLDFRARKVRFQVRTCHPEEVVFSTVPERFHTRLLSTGLADVCGR